MEKHCSYCDYFFSRVTEDNKVQMYCNFFCKRITAGRKYGCMNFKHTKTKSF